MSVFADELLPELKFLFLRAAEEVEEHEASVVQSDLTVRDVLRAHFSIADFFLREGEGEGIGGYGPKETSMLISAVYRQHVGFGGVSKWKTVHEKAATLLYGLIMNHPFYDANKRTAYLSTVHYLFTNNYMLSITEKELEDLTVLIAERGLDKFPRYRELKKKSDDAEVEFLAWYLKSKTHLMDRRQYIITYRELEKILKGYDVLLQSPSNNSIDVMRWEDVEVRRSGIFSKAKTTKELRRVCSLGFPGWSKEIGKGRLKHLRSELGLTPEHGVDSQSFFNGVDDMQGLLGKYQNALRRLANR